ncbi:3-methyl-2-oxobutanoate hydroxymethyltransferase, partial [Escherichia coli]|uniref:3-methyl-2-oxobutanoate hydroxymethyltransferase n=1 Tax=Escherichia coli TaxID=562 RepID=UPI003F4A8CCF
MTTNWNGTFGQHLYGFYQPLAAFNFDHVGPSTHDSRGAPNCLLLADLPFMAYATPEQAFENAATVMRAGANMVKIEGGEWLVETVQ